MDLQCKEVLKKLSRIHGIFYTMRNYMPISTMMTLYYSLAYPTIIQNIIIWGGISVSHTCNVKIKMNKILRCILRVKYSDNNVPLLPTEEMYKSLAILNFKQAYEYFLLKFIHFYFYKNPLFFNLYFMNLLPRHEYSTRNTRIHYPSIRVEIEKQSTIYQCCQLINSIDYGLLVPQSDYQLKRNFRLYALTDS